MILTLARSSSGPVEAPVEQPPVRQTAIVGGVEYSVGGWGAYEINKRRARWEVTGGRTTSHYPNRTYIYADDAVLSIFGGGNHTNPLRTAMKLLEEEVKRYEERQCMFDDKNVWVCDSLSMLDTTTQSITNIMNIPNWDTDVGVLSEIHGLVGGELTLPELPGHAVAVADAAAVHGLESDVEEFTSALEIAQGKLAELVDKYAASIAIKNNIE